MPRTPGALGYVKFPEQSLSTAVYLVRQIQDRWVIALPSEKDGEGAVEVQTEQGSKEWIMYRKVTLPAVRTKAPTQAFRFSFEDTEEESEDGIPLATLIDRAPPALMSGVVSPFRVEMSPDLEVRRDPDPTPTDGKRLDALEGQMERLMLLVEKQTTEVQGLAAAVQGSGRVDTGHTKSAGVIPSLLDQPGQSQFGESEIAEILATEGRPPILGQAFRPASRSKSVPRDDPEVRQPIADPLAMAQLKLLESMTERLSSRRAESDDGFDVDDSRDFRSRADGLEKLHQLARAMNSRPKEVYLDFERRVARELGIRDGEGQSAENPGLKVARYFETRVPLKNTSKTTIRFAYAVSEVYRRLALGEVDQARAQLALLAGAIEQYAIDHERWEAGWLMAHMPEPNFHLFPKEHAASSTECANCMDPTRVRAAWKHFKEVGQMREIKKKNAGAA